MNAKTPRCQDAKVGKRGTVVVRWLLGLLLCLAAGVGFVGEVEDDGGLMEQLEGLDAKLAEVESLDARFEQRRYTPLLKKPIASAGRVRALAGESRWDTDEPYASVMRITSDRLELYYPEQKTLEVYPVEQRLGEVAASPMPRLSAWVEDFNIERADHAELPESLRQVAGDEADGKTLVVKLTPKAEGLAEQVALIWVVIDVQTGLSRAMSWSSGEEGERTEIRFEEAKVNRGVKRSDLVIQPAAGTRVVYPLGPVEDGAGDRAEDGDGRGDE